jgi:hypothetical protein
MICTRPDDSYALSMSSRYQSNPGESHWIVVKNILKYLKGTKNSFLVYGGEEKQVVMVTTMLVVRLTLMDLCLSLILYFVYMGLL